MRASDGLTAETLSVVMVGAGFGMAAVPGSLTWRGLIEKVATKMEINVGSVDSRIAAMMLSWIGSQKRVTAEESAFQRIVADCVKAAHLDQQRDDELLDRIADLALRVHCDVVIDLNYDTLVEEALDKAKIPYYRIIGAQLDIHAPLPKGTVVLWKVHGSVEHPATIVLSPTEYQRIYEVNDLGGELAKLGAKTHTVWTVGVGLLDDDVWSHLTSKANDLEVVSFWVTEGDRSQDAEETLQAWIRMLDAGAGVTRATVLNAVLGKNSRALLSSIDHFLCEFGTQSEAQPRQTARLAATLRKFDEQWGMASKIGTQRAISFVVDEFEQDYSDLFHFMLTRGKTRGKRWLPFLNANGPIPDRHALADEFHAVLLSCKSMMKDFAGEWPTRGLLLGCCVQAIVRNVCDWLDSFDIPYTIEPTQDPLKVVQRGTYLVVGANPFDPDVRADVNAFNLIHAFTYKNDPLKLEAPLTEEPLPSSKSRPSELLTEDEWECAVRSLFVNSAPELKIDGLAPIALTKDWIFPVFPWGFGRNGLAAYRSTSKGTVTRAWHLVSNQSASRYQICKGGSLRDRGERAFMLGRRGQVRIGESDDFVQRTARIY